MLRQFLKNRIQRRLLCERQRKIEPLAGQALLDEPTNALDNDGVQLIYSIIKEEKQRGATVIVATHHKEDLDELCDTILTVSEGRLIE